MRIKPTGKSSLTPCRRLFGFVACAFGAAYSSISAVLLQSWAGSGLAGRWAWAAACVVLLLAVYTLTAERITLNPGGDIHMRVAGGAMGVFIGGVVLIFKGVRGLVKLLGAFTTRLQRARRSRNGKASDNLMDATDVGSPTTMVLSTVRGASAWLVVRSGGDPGTIVEIKGSGSPSGAALTPMSASSTAPHPLCTR